MTNRRLSDIKMAIAKDKIKCNQINSFVTQAGRHM